MRLAAVGTQIVLDPTIQGTHLKHWTLAQMVRTDLFERGIPGVELLVESRNGSSALNLVWRHRLSTLAVLVGFVLAPLPGGLLVATGYFCSGRWLS